MTRETCWCGHVAEVHGLQGCRTCSLHRGLPIDWRHRFRPIATLPPLPVRVGMEWR